MNSKEIVSQHHAKWNAPPAATPANKAVDGPLMGNGDMGVAIGGNAQEHRFILCKNDLWRLQHAYDMSCPVPLGELSIVFKGHVGADYKVKQDIYTATTTGVFEKKGTCLTLRSYVAATHNLLLVEIAVTGREVEARAALRISGGRGAETQSGVSGPVFWGMRSFAEGVDVPTGAAAAWTLTDRSRLHTDGSFTLSPDRPVTLVLSMESMFTHDDYAAEARDALDDLGSVREQHEAWWANYWDTSFVRIGDPIIEKQYYLSLYGLGSCSRNPEFPPPIFGWTTTDDPLWAGDYHLNYNHQAPFYGLARANRIAQADPHDAPFLDFMERAAWHCREMYGHAGGIYPVGIGPKGIETTYDSRRFVAEGPTRAEHGGLFFGQRTNGAYGLVNVAARWNLTHDIDYAQKVYAFVLQIATFWTHYLRWEPMDSAQADRSGRYVIDSDSIHEGSGPDFNNCLSIALIQNALQLALDISEQLDPGNADRSTWAHILEDLCVYTTQERQGKTVFRYSEKGVDWWDNNTLGIQQIYPAGAIHLESDAEWLSIARNTIAVMQRWHDRNGSNSFFPAAVRVGYDAATVLKELRTYAEHTYPNGFQKDNAHGIENLSTVHNTINEMLCMDHKGVLRLFPVWPVDKDASFVSIRCWGAFLVSGALKDGVVQPVTILSEKGRDCTLVNPWAGRPMALVRNGVAAEVLTGSGITFPTRIGETIEVKRSGGA